MTKCRTVLRTYSFGFCGALLAVSVMGLAGCGRASLHEGEGSAEGYCGDKVCGDSESPESCSADCLISCGNGTCDGFEVADPNSCPKDCVVCGDGVCSPSEDKTSCPKDCPVDTCGNGKCDPTETQTSCPEECGRITSCGNGVCEPVLGENHEFCPKDCDSALCGNQICEGNEGNDVSLRLRNHVLR